MKPTKILFNTAAISAGLLFTACTPPDIPMGNSSGVSMGNSSKVSMGNSYIYNGINFGADRNADFKQGVRDACRTEDGDYTKNHTMFKNNESYMIGWEDGRLKCKGK
jgi:hypothetical protein